MDTHYCSLHNSKFYRNEKADRDGEIKVWYSHKLKDGSGFCSEKNLEKVEQTALLKEEPNHFSPSGMYTCNAMNNAVALACNGKIPLDQIGSYFKKILSNLEATL